MQNFIATDADIRDLAKAYLKAVEAGGSTAGRYLQVLIGTAQEGLRKAKAPIEMASHLTGLKAVHKRFYAVVVDTTATPDIAADGRHKPEERKRRAKERNRRTNFARTAYSTVRGWVKSGHDLMTLEPAKVSKQQLIAKTTRTAKPASIDRVRGKVDKLVASILDSVKAIERADPSAARAVLDDAVAKMHQKLLGGKGSAKWPTETQVLRRARIKLAA